MILAGGLVGYGVAGLGFRAYIVSGIDALGIAVDGSKSRFYVFQNSMLAWRFDWLTLI